MADGWLRERLRATWADRWVVLQIGVAAGLAWFLAEMALGQTNAFFAPAAAVLVVGGSVGRQLRQTFELIAGVTVGLILADGLVHLIGRGPLQLAVVVVLAASLALLVSGGKMLLNQATTTAVLIVALYPSAGGGIYYQRWLDALIGAGVALGVRAVIVPLQPLFALRQSAGTLRSTIAEAFDGGSTGLRTADREATLAAADRLESAQAVLRDLSQETERIAKVISIGLIHQRTRQLLSRVRAKLPHLGGALANTHLALRIEADHLAEAAPHELVEAVSALARASDELVHTLLHPVDRARDESADRVAAWAGRISDTPPASVSPDVADHVRTAAGELLRAARGDPALS